jgi:hypothetical protein
MRKLFLAAVAAFLICQPAAAAEVCKAHLMRGIGEVFSTGLYTLAGKLRAQGIETEVSSHLNYASVVNEIVRNPQRGHILIGHSQGSNASLQAAINLAAMGRKVDLVVTFVPVGDTWYVASSVKHYINFFQKGYWGSDVQRGRGFTGRYDRYDLANNWSIWHANIEKSAALHAVVVQAVAGLRAKGVCR